MQISAAWCFFLLSQASCFCFVKINFAMNILNINGAAGMWGKVNTLPSKTNQILTSRFILNWFKVMVGTQIFQSEDKRSQ